MGVMDVLGGLLGRKAPKSGNPLLDALLPMLLKGGGALGGLSGLLSGFANAGLGTKADSWVSGGPNEGLSAEEVERALGADGVAKLARKAGVDQSEAAGQLAKVLPSIVDHLTPGGSVPSGGGLGQLAKSLDVGKLTGLLGR